MIDNLTLTLMNQPQEEKYDDSKSAITSYEIITTFIKIHNISATWEAWADDHPNGDAPNDKPDMLNYQLKVGSFWCYEGLMFECCPPK